MTQYTRPTGVGAILSGAVLVPWILLVFLNPTGGFVGYLDPLWVLWNLGIGIGVLGLYGQLAMRWPRLSLAAAAIALLGVTISITQAVVGGLALVLGGGMVGPIRELEFLLAVAGFVGLLLGSVLLGAISLADDCIPRWMAGLLVGASIVAFGVDDTSGRILLLLPFAVGWLSIGTILWKTRPSMGRAKNPTDSK